MKKLRIAIILLLLNLTIFFNIERVDFVMVNPLNVPSFIYMLQIAAVMSTLLFGPLRHLPASLVLGLFFLIYVVSKAFLLASYPIFGGVYTYITVTEIIFLSIGVLLAHYIARALADFEDAVETITFADIKQRVRLLSERQDDIDIEMARSRRYGRPVTVLVIEPDKESVSTVLHRTIHEVQKAMAYRYVFLDLARLILNHMRRMDITAQIDSQQRLVIVCPETQAEAAHTTLNRIQEAAQLRLGLKIHTGSAAFPDDALTFDEAIQQATQRMNIPANNTRAPLNVEDDELMNEVWDSPYSVAETAKDQVEI